MNSLSLFKKILLGLVIVFLFGNLLALDYFFFFKESKREKDVPFQASPTPTVFLSDRGEFAEGSSDVCPQACLDLIDTPAGEAGQISPAVELGKEEKQIVQSLAKEVYVPLGSGTVTSVDWREIDGLEAVIDRANYSQIKSIIFEGSLSIPTGNGVVSAKLFNVTDKHEVWFSQIEAQGTSSQRTESKEISLSSGRKLYRVMMKSSMNYEAKLENARLKIILE